MKKFSLNLKQKDDFSSWLVGDEYEVTKLIGQGSYGSVAEAIHKKTNKKVAIKRMEDLFADEEDCKKMVREIKLLRAMSKGNYVTKLLDIIMPQPSLSDYKDLYIVMEFVDADLKKVLKSSLTLSELHVQVILYNALCAVNWLHSLGVLHRDIKPSNILIDEDCQTKLCDFGLSRSYAGLPHSPTKYFEEVK
mmetsp:Transcript_39853/g.29405  ORF Transcript_39853/g.29405 Transcript_39853/m.29405 type:complete len:192 (+) Transcript_39853:3-578(+)